MNCFFHAIQFRLHSIRVGFSKRFRCLGPRAAFLNGVLVCSQNFLYHYRKTLESVPADATHWSTRSMARAMHVSQTAVTRIWHAFGLQPHRQETFKLSTDPLFVKKVRDIVGLYLDPPLKAMVLCVDEKSQIQALDRTQPILPLAPGIAERRTSITSAIFMW